MFLSAGSARVNARRVVLNGAGGVFFSTTESGWLCEECQAPASHLLSISSFATRDSKCASLDGKGNYAFSRSVSFSNE